MNGHFKSSFAITSVCKCCLFLFVVLFLYGCGGRPVVPVYEPDGQSTYPPPTVPDIETVPSKPSTDKFSGPAAPLYKKAKSLLAQHEYQQAELAIERALRIEPKNGYYWYTFAEIAFTRKQYGRTVQLCLKAKSLAGGDSRLIGLSDALIAKSR